MKLAISSLFLDIENFRHKKVSSESEAIRELLSNELLHKVAELAEDIVSVGMLDPSSLLIVAENEKVKGRYIALEGNRRIAALKTMASPSLADGLSTQSRFRTLSPRFLALNIKDVECVVLDKSAASIWIKRKHYKGMGGAGVLQWKAVATARSDASEGRHSKWMGALAFLELGGIDAEDLRESISRKTTTIERVLSSSHMSSLLGISISREGEVTAENGDQGAAVTLINSMLEQMAESDFVESKVSTASQQKDFLDQFARLSVKKKPSASTSSAVWGAESSPKASSSGGAAAPHGSSATAGGASKGRKTPKDRKSLAAKGLHISNSALNKFYGELCSLKVDKYRHTSAAIVRVFLEKASMVFLEEFSIQTKKPGADWSDYGIKLREKVEAVLLKIDPDKKDKSLKYARDVANGNADQMHTLDALNNAIHDHKSIPSERDVLTIWDRYHPYFNRLFTAIENKNP